jgi:predicted Zn-dependent protease
MTSRGQLRAAAFFLAWAAGAVGVMLCSSLLFSGCSAAGSIAKVGTSIGVASGVIDQSQASSIVKSTEAVAKTFQDITPEQEYYIGRAVGAVLVGKYNPCHQEKATMYLNVLGQTLAQASDLPETFGGYHFSILDSDEINAFAAPGGLIFVTRGMLRCCKHEDAVAAVLAHEIGHVQYKHGLQAIQKSRVTEALTTIALEGGKSFGGENLAQLTQVFENSLSDITTTLVNNGYSRAFESQADGAAVAILRRVGYSPNGLVDMLKVMEQRLTPGGLDFAKTHPSPGDRIAEIQKIIGAYTTVKAPQGRQGRFVASLGDV